MRLDWDLLRNAINKAGDVDLPAHCDARPVGGGDISASFGIDCGSQRYFLKLNDTRALAMFGAEADGLRAMSQIDGIRVPEVVTLGASESHSFLLLEWLDLRAGDERGEVALARGLAALHRTASTRFGWRTDNFIGSTVQHNRQCSDWARFFGEQRLAPQLSMAASHGFVGSLQDLGHQLMIVLPDLLAGHEPEISLTHGDLWGGNRAWLDDGTPVLFDPAICFADRETDLAMTRLFGGFGPAFYRAYEEAWPLPDDSEKRVGLYQLYHLLNHLNLFGSGYLPRCIGVMENLLRP